MSCVAIFKHKKKHRSIYVCMHVWLFVSQSVCLFVCLQCGHTRNQLCIHLSGCLSTIGDYRYLISKLLIFECQNKEKNFVRLFVCFFNISILILILKGTIRLEYTRRWRAIRWQLYYSDDDGDENPPIIITMELLTPQILRAIRARQVLILGAHRQLDRLAAWFQPLNK